MSRSSPAISATIKTDAHRYRRVLEHFLSVCEQPGIGSPPANELALQAKFYGGEFGDSWRSLCGREVRLLDPGEWNREAGPDFRNVTVLVDGEERLRGDLEIDLRASGWEQHGHAKNPEFEDVVLHLFFQSGTRRCFARTPSNRAVLQVQLFPPAGASVAFSGISEPLDDPAIALELISIASAHRLQKKAAKISMLEQLHGRRRALFQSLAEGFGYRQNQIPMALVAQRSGVQRAVSEDGEALLFGLAGFLRGEDFDATPNPNRKYLRSLWEKWWPLRDKESRMILPQSTWKFSGIRPANHPHRRIAALCLAARSLDRLLRAADSQNPDAFSKILSGISHPFWDTHWNLAGESLPEGSTVALVGSNRITELLTNIFGPMVAARGGDPQPCLSRLRCKPVPSSAKRIATWLCPLIPQEQLTFSHIQQGLYQLGTDFRGLESPKDLARRMLERP